MWSFTFTIIVLLSCLRMCLLVVVVGGGLRNVEAIREIMTLGKKVYRVYL